MKKTQFMEIFSSLNCEALVETSIFSENDKYRDDVINRLTKKIAFTPEEDRAFGTIYGMVFGDAIGARYEFDDIRYGKKDLFGMGTGEGGPFMLRPGQWTDDSSMGLCVADSFLCNHGQWKPHDCMQRFLAWENFGLNNAFRYDKHPAAAQMFDGARHSIGCGGMISHAFAGYLRDLQAYTTWGDFRSSGNGSVMRLAPLPVALHNLPLAEAQQIAHQHSLTTHRGDEAAECCALLTHIIIRCIRGEGLRDVLSNLGKPAISASSSSSPASSSSSSSSFSPVSSCSSPSLAFTTACPGVAALVQSVCEKQRAGECEGSADETRDDPDRNWNWRIGAQYRYSEYRYNHDKQKRERKSRGYMGSYAMDATCMALNIAWRFADRNNAINPVHSAEDAVLTAANLCGDADSVASVTGQLVGAACGMTAFPAAWLHTVQQWDPRNDIGLRAFRLFHGLWVDVEEEVKEEEERERERERKEERKEKEKGKM